MPVLPSAAVNADGLVEDSTDVVQDWATADQSAILEPSIYLHFTNTSTESARDVLASSRPSDVSDLHCVAETEPIPDLHRVAGIKSRFVGQALLARLRSALHSVFSPQSRPLLTSATSSSHFYNSEVAAPYGATTVSYTHLTLPTICSV